MHIVLVAEKPYVAKTIIPYAYKKWSGAKISIISALPYTHFNFDYPEKSPSDDYPFISEPRNKIIPFENWICPAHIVSEDGTHTSGVPMSKQIFDGMDELVFACDPHHTGAYAFDALAAALTQDPYFSDQCKALILSGMDEQSICKAFVNPPCFGQVMKEHLEYAVCKRFFEWNWNVNSLVLLGETLHRAGGCKNNSHLVSKFALQTLFYLQHGKPLSEFEILKHMHKWKGTDEFCDARKGIGSEASRCMIIHNLTKCCLLVAQDKKIKISDLGLRFLSLLHPDFKDPNLPCRIDLWGTYGLEQSQDEISDYVLRRFEKQKQLIF